jgi:hypothetical protein
MIPVIAPFLSLVAKKDSKKEVLIGQWLQMLLPIETSE